MGSRAASFSGSVPTGLCIGCEAETANHRTRYGGGCWPSTKCSAATLVRTCLAKAIEECRAPRDAACGHAASPAQAAPTETSTGGGATSPCCVTRSKRLGSPNDDNHRGRCLLSSAPCQPLRPWPWASPTRFRIAPRLGATSGVAHCSKHSKGRP